MSPKLIAKLQTLFWVMGWAVLMLAAGTIAFQAYEYFRPVDPTALFTLPKREFSLVMSLRILFGAIGQAFFAFLVSAVFGMICKKSFATAEQTEKFLLLTIVGFVGEGLISVGAWIHFLPHLFDAPFTLDGTGLMALSYLMSLCSHLSSFVYAITIYVLYRHFSQLVTFESEVV